MEIKLDTIILFVTDVDKLKQFYADIFKFDIVEELTAEWVLLNTGNCHIGLHKIGKEYLDKSDSDIKFESNLKIVFEVDNIYNLREKLLVQNVRIREMKTFDNYNYWLCDGEDPEGNVFQLKQKKNNARSHLIYKCGNNFLSRKISKCSRPNRQETSCPEATGSFDRIVCRLCFFEII